MRTLWVALFVILLFAGCQPVMKMIYGIKNPDIENEKSIRKKALKLDLDTSNIVTVNSKDFLYELKARGIPDGGIYDRNGRYIEYRQADTSCNAGLFQFIPALNLNDTYNQPSKPDMFEEFSKFRDLKGSAVKPPIDADFYLFIYWTVWAGRLNKDHVKIWEDLAHENKNCKIKVIKVNLDIQEYWEEEEQQRVIRAMRGK